MRKTVLGFVAVLGLADMVGAQATRNVFVDSTDLVPGSLPGTLMATGITALPADPALPIVGADAPPAATLLRRHILAGRSAGFGGLLYENRDRGHSLLPPTYFPNLSYVKYGLTLRYDRHDRGAARRIVFPAPLVGNSSTAIAGGPRARSLTRLAMTSRGGPQLSFLHYISNSLYIYPEHRDHDAEDLFPANWAYAVNSQGSSGSDQPFMSAMLMTLAAFSAETRAALQRHGLIAPTLQMLMRQSLVGVNTAGDYMSARAHPSAFDGAALRPERMIDRAVAMTPDAIPPLVHLTVEAEDFTDRAGLGNKSEMLFTTPAAIARLWRAHDWQREMTVSAANTRDPNGRDLVFHWVLLRGNPQKVEIEPLEPKGLRARLRIAWHDPFPAPPIAPSEKNPRTTSRVDIAVFASNGVMLSAPSFISVSFPAHQVRRYEKQQDGFARLVSVDYDATARGVLFDPTLYWSAPWKDKFRYGRDGRLLGWSRAARDGTTDFAPDTPVPEVMIRQGENGLPVLEVVQAD